MSPKYHVPGLDAEIVNLMAEEGADDFVDLIDDEVFAVMEDVLENGFTEVDFAEGMIQFGTCEDCEGFAEVVSEEVPAASNVGPLVKKAFDAYMVLEEDLEIGQHRLLETDNKLYLPS